MIFLTFNQKFVKQNKKKKKQEKKVAEEEGNKKRKKINVYLILILNFSVMHDKVD